VNVTMHPDFSLIEGVLQEIKLDLGYGYQSVIKDVCKRMGMVKLENIR